MNLEGLFRLFLLNQPQFDESVVRRNYAGNAWLCNVVSQLSRVQNRSVQRYMRSHNIQHGFLNVPDTLQALARWPNSKTWLLFQRIVTFAAQVPVALAAPVAQPPIVLGAPAVQPPIVLAAPVVLPPIVLAAPVVQPPIVLAAPAAQVPVAQVPVAPAAQVPVALAAPAAQVLVAQVPATIRAPVPIQWVRDSYFTQDNYNFLVLHRLPFIIFIGIIDQGCGVDLHYTTMYLRLKFIKKMHKRREILGSWGFIGVGDCYRLYRANLEVIFKFEGIPEDVVCTPADIGIDVQVCCSVCVEDVQPTEPMYLFECLHVFHKACIDQWKLAKHVNVTCPNCRALI
jgi:hypothetical protein